MVPEVSCIRDHPTLPAVGAFGLDCSGQTSSSIGCAGFRLFDQIRQAPAQARVEIAVMRSSARRSARGPRKSAFREARLAERELYWQEVTILANPSSSRSTSVPLNLMHVQETSVPRDGSDPLEWFLLTSLLVEHADAAEQLLDYYRWRWRIEDWHRILKSANGRSTGTCDCDQGGDCLAPACDGAVGTGHAGVAGRGAVLQSGTPHAGTRCPRPQTPSACEFGQRGMDHGHARRLSGSEKRPTAQTQSDLDRLDRIRCLRPSL